MKIHSFVKYKRMENKFPFLKFIFSAVAIYTWFFFSSSLNQFGHNFDAYFLVEDEKRKKKRKRRSMKKKKRFRKANRSYINILLEKISNVLLLRSKTRFLILHISTENEENEIVTHLMHHDFFPFFRSNSGRTSILARCQHVKYRR